MLEAILALGRQPLTPDDYVITQVASGQDSLSFQLHRQDPAIQILEERTRILETVTRQTFWISAIDAGQKSVTFTARKDLGDWEKTVYTGYINSKDSVTAKSTISPIVPDGWMLRFAEEDTLMAHIEMQGPTPLEIVEHCMEVYGIGAVFDNNEKTLTVHFPDKKTLGTSFLVNSANLRAEPEFKGKATNLITRLYAQGADNVTFERVNGGKQYVECFDYTDEVIAGYWRDERYTVPEHLLAAAKEKVKALSQPERSWSLEVCDLSAIDGESWPGIALDMFSVVQLIDRTQGRKLEARIIEKRTCPHHPERNEISVSAVAGTLTYTRDAILRRLRTGRIYEGMEITVDRVKTAADQALEDALEAQEKANDAQQKAQNAWEGVGKLEGALEDLEEEMNDVRTVSSEIVQKVNNIRLRVTGPNGAVSEVSLDANGRINLSGDVIAQRINTDTLMARDLKATGSFQVENGVWKLVQNTDGFSLGLSDQLSEDGLGQAGLTVTPGQVTVYGNRGIHLTGPVDAGSIETDSLFIGGELIGDFVISQGTSGVWSYRIWNSGRQELWGTVTVTLPNSLSQWGNGYYAPNLTLSLPLSMKNAVVTGTCNQYQYVSNAGVSGSTLTYTLISPMQMAGQGCTVKFYIVA